MARLLKVAAVVCALLACAAPLPSAGGRPFAGAGEDAADGAHTAPDHHPALAVAGDWYRREDKRAFATVQKGDGNPTICRGQAMDLTIELRRVSETGSGSGDYTSSSVQVQYRKSKFRDCATDEAVSTSTYYSSGTSASCCSDETTVYGYESVADAGTFTLSQDKKGLAHAKAKVEVPLYDRFRYPTSTTFTTTSGGGGEPPVPVGTAVIDLRVDCVTLNQRDSTTSSESCTDGNCIIIKSQSASTRCRGRYGDATVSGTVELQGPVQLQLDLSSPPPGYTAVGRVGRRTSSNRAFE